MDDDSKPLRRSELRQALQKLTTGDGVKRDDIVAALRGELRELQQCWHVSITNGPEVARTTIILNLRAHVALLNPRPDRQGLSTQDRRRQYDHAISVCFNASGHADLEGMDLTQRQRWLANKARSPFKIDDTTCRRDLRDALDQIERQILAPGYQPVQVDRVTGETQAERKAAANDEGPPDSAASISSPLTDVATPSQPDSLSIPAGSLRWYRRFHRIKRRHVVLAALIALACGGLSAFGTHLAEEGSRTTAGKLVAPPLAVPRTISKVELCRENGNELYALDMSPGVLLNLGIANVTAGATKWSLSTDATYNQQVETLFEFGNRTSAHQSLGLTVQLVQPFSHKGDIWKITWRARAGPTTSELSVSVNLGRPDASLVYVPGGSKLLSPNPATRKDHLSLVSDSEVLDPSQPIQTLYPDSLAGASSISAHFLVVVPGFVVKTTAERPRNSNWLSSLYALPGDILLVAVTVEDGGNTTLYGTTINLTLPQGLSYKPGSTSIASSMIARSKPASDGIVVSNDYYPGINLGTLLPGQQVVIRLKVRVNTNVSDGAILSSVAMGHATNMAYYIGTLTVYVQ